MPTALMEGPRDREVSLWLRKQPLFCDPQVARGPNTHLPQPQQSAPARAPTQRFWAQQAGPHHHHHQVVT